MKQAARCILPTTIKHDTMNTDCFLRLFPCSSACAPFPSCAMGAFSTTLNSTGDHVRMQSYSTCTFKVIEMFYHLYSLEMGWLL